MALSTDNVRFNLSDTVAAFSGAPVRQHSWLSLRATVARVVWVNTPATLFDPDDDDEELMSQIEQRLGEYERGERRAKSYDEAVRFLGL